MKFIPFIFLLIPYIFTAQINNYTPLQFLYFADHTYDDQIFKYKTPSGITLFNTVLNINSNGFYKDTKSDYQSIALLDSATHTIIISHRGTEFNKIKDLHVVFQIVYSNVNTILKRRKKQIVLKPIQYITNPVRLISILIRY